MAKPYIVILLSIVVLFTAGYLLLKHEHSQMIPTNSIPSQRVEVSRVPSMTTDEESAQVTQIPLTVTTPTNGFTVTTPEVTVSGKTVANADVFVDDTQMKADKDGNFSSSVQLDEGDNTIVVVANDASGNYSEKDITVTYPAPGE